MTDEEVIKYKDDLEMMKRPRLWPMMFLPLINRTLKREGDLVGMEGILFCQGKGKDKFSFLAGQNMYMPIPEGAKFKDGGVEMLQQLIKDGWQVD